MGAKGNQWGEDGKGENRIGRVDVTGKDKNGRKRAPERKAAEEAQRFRGKGGLAAERNLMRFG